VAISTAVAATALEQAYDSLARGGTLVLVGLPAENHVRLPIVETVLGGRTVMGTSVGTHHDLEEVFQLHALGRTRVVCETRELEQVNEAFHEVETGSSKAPRLVFQL
jgi:propanol-preferring alcohol dehydrogenase